MLADPEIPLTMMVTLMDRYGLKSHEVKQRWRDAYKYWLTEEMRVYHGRSSAIIMEAVYLRVLHVCEPTGEHKRAMKLAAVELALRHRNS